MRTSEKIEIGNWVLRIGRPESGRAQAVLFMLHGWKGDEDVMWIFADSAPKNFLLIAPRAPLTAPGSGYSWVDRSSEAYSSLDQFSPSVRELQNLLASLPGRLQANWDAIHLMGFSQGAALCYAWALVQPAAIQTVAGMAGFVPEGVERYQDRQPLAGMPIFVAHGSRDTTVPVEKMRSDLRLLEAAGADVTYCEDQTGHKMSTTCLRSLATFYAQISGQ